MQTPGSRVKKGGPGGSGRKPYEKKQGLFVNGVWQCDCNPRLPAIHFQVKKQGPNHGRWFYTCQKSRDGENKCKFFLWEEDAQPREQSALMANSRTEPSTPSINRTRPRPATSTSTPSRPAPSEHHRFKSPPPPYSVENNAAGSARKRHRVITDDDDSDEFGINRGDSAFDLLQEMMDGETPRKAQRTDAFTTPRRKLPWTAAADGIPTPRTDERAAVEPFSARLAKLGESSVAPSKSQSSGASSSTVPAAISPFTTPTPASRFKDVVAQDPHVEDSIVDEVFNLLNEEKVHLGSKASAALKTVLKKHARRAEGNSKSKEVLRLRIKAEEAKNMELSLRNNTLQAELDAAKAAVSHFQWEKGQDADE